MDEAEPLQEGDDVPVKRDLTVRNCKHQKGVPVPCASPSCPQGVQGKRLTLSLTTGGTVTFRRRFRGRWEWALEEKP
jgi:hypothetical protein